MFVVWGEEKQCSFPHRHFADDQVLKPHEKDFAVNRKGGTFILFLSMQMIQLWRHGDQNFKKLYRIDRKCVDRKCIEKLNVMESKICQYIAEELHLMVNG